MENQILRNYGVKFKYFKEDNEFTQIHFAVEVIYKGELQNGSHYFSINKKKIFIDNKAPDLIIEQLAEKAGSCLYPMEILTSPEGPFQEIVNYEAIKKRWDAQKIELENYYVGEISDKIIKKLNGMYSSKQRLELAIKEDLFLKLFFMPIYRKHINRIAEYAVDVAFIPSFRPREYQIVQEVSPFLTKSKKQQIHLKGVHDFGAGKTSLEFNYKINNETKSIFSIVGKIDLEAENNTTKQIYVEIYQLE